jgi:hypothetical protein
VPECARPELGWAVEVANHMTRRDFRRNGIGQFRLSEFLVPGARAIERSLDFVMRK